MRTPLAIAFLVFLAACTGPEIDHVAENHTVACAFLVEEMRAVSAEILQLPHPLEVRYSGPCACGVTYWHIVGSDASDLKICLENGLHFLVPEPHRRRFGIGNCHGQPNDIVFPVGSAEEMAIVSAFSLWLIDEFSLEELVASETQPDRCLTRDYLDPAATASVLTRLFDSDPVRFRLAHEILACSNESRD